jgi:hypothetical protein
LAWALTLTQYLDDFEEEAPKTFAEVANSIVKDIVNIRQRLIILCFAFMILSLSTNNYENYIIVRTCWELYFAYKNMYIYEVQNGEKKKLNYIPVFLMKTRKNQHKACFSTVSIVYPLFVVFCDINVGQNSKTALR